jgi:hypothetical protein
MFGGVSETENIGIFRNKKISYIKVVYEEKRIFGFYSFYGLKITESVLRAFDSKRCL